MSRKVEGMKEGRHCPRCGKEAREGASFCTACGADLRGGDARPTEAGRAGEATRETEEAYSSIPRPPGAGAAASGLTPGASRRRRLAVVLGLAGGLFLLAGAVLLALYLFLWRGGGDAGDPLSLARKYMRALEERNVESLEECFHPGYFSPEEGTGMEGLGLNMRKMAELGMGFMKFRFSNVRLRVEEEDALGAVVVTTGGGLSLSMPGWKRDFDLGENPMRFRMTRREGRWYLVEDPVEEFVHDNLGPVDGGEFLENPGIREFMEKLLEEMGFDERELEDLEEMWREMKEWQQEEGEASPAEVAT